MNAKREELTAGERRYLEHVRRAGSQGMELSQYCRSVGLNPFSLYSMRRQMRRKGLLAPAQQAASAAGAKEPRVPGRFVAVRVGEPAVPAAATAAGLVCRLRHPSGWMIECGSWPESSWVQALVGVGP
jgi:transposase-like protein